MKIRYKTQYYFEDNEVSQLELFLHENKMTLKEFAELCGISATLMTMIKQGRRSISKSVLNKFAKNGLVFHFDSSFYEK